MEKKSVPLQWKEDFNVNIKFIDEQHQYFFKVLKDLETHVNSGNCRENISGIFYSLVYYADNYLIQEEIYFRELNYPGIKEHHLKHNFFVEGIINFKDDYATGKADVCKNLLNFMTEYFHDHILGYDIKTVEYLKSLREKLQ